MRRLSVLVALAATAGLAACSTDVDLYAGYREVPVVYGILDASADTNYVKITRALYAPGDAYQAAANPDSSNYPGRLDVRLVEYCNGDSVREIILDTITLHNKGQGVFYAPHQKLYFTAELLHTDNEAKSYSYRLKAVLPGGLLAADAKIVGNDGFQVQGLAVNFSKQYLGLRMPFHFRPAVNAAIYDVFMKFTFLEQRDPEGDSVSRSVRLDGETVPELVAERKWGFKFIGGKQGYNSEQK